MPKMWSIGGISCELENDVYSTGFGYTIPQMPLGQVGSVVNIIYTFLNFFVCSVYFCFIYLKFCN